MALTRECESRPETSGRSVLGGRSPGKYRLSCDRDLEVPVVIGPPDSLTGGGRNPAAKHAEGGRVRSASVAGEENTVARKPELIPPWAAERPMTEWDGTGEPQERSRAGARSRNTSSRGMPRTFFLRAMHGFGRSKPSRG